MFKNLRDYEFPKLVFASFFLSFAFGAINGFWSLLLYETIGLDKSQLGFFSATMSIISIITMLFVVPRLTKRINERTLTMFSYVVLILSYLLVIRTDNVWVFGFIIFFAMIATRTRDSGFNIVFKNFASVKNRFRNYGIMYSFRNIASLVAPSIAGFIVSIHSVQLNIVYASTMFFISFILFMIFTKDYKPITKKINSNHEHKKIKSENLIKFFSNYDYIRAYIVNCGTFFWFFFMVYYVPIYFIENGISEVMIGIFVSTLSIPLILGEYKIAKLENEENVRIVLFIGYLIMGTVAVATFLVDDVLFRYLILPLSMLGVASIEPSKEMYFFSQVNKNGDDENELFPIYITALDIGTIGSSLLFGIYFLFFNSYEYTFLFVAGIIALILFILGNRIVVSDLKLFKKRN